MRGSPAADGAARVGTPLALSGRTLIPPHSPIAMTQPPTPGDHSHEVAEPSEALFWRNRYEGLLSIACFRGKEVAGISGPWSGKFALTWWDRPLPQRQLELFDSLDDAQRKVEAWAQRMHRGVTRSVIACAPTKPQPRIEVGLLDRLRDFFPSPARRKPTSRPHDLERSRRARDEQELNLGDLHFNAGENTHRPS